MKYGYCRKCKNLINYKVSTEQSQNILEAIAEGIEEKYGIEKGRHFLVINNNNEIFTELYSFKNGKLYWQREFESEAIEHEDSMTFIKDILDGYWKVVLLHNGFYL